MCEVIDIVSLPVNYSYSAIERIKLFIFRMGKTCDGIIFCIFIPLRSECKYEPKWFEPELCEAFFKQKNIKLFDCYPNYRDECIEL